MNKPIQETSAEIQTKELTEKDEPFVTALRNRKYEVIFFGDKKGPHEFFCSDYCTYNPPPMKDEYPIMRNLYPSGEWKFLDVIMDTSKRGPDGKVTQVKLTYHPEVSLVNVPFMVLPAEGEG
jgi:hypothetical protein